MNVCLWTEGSCDSTEALFVPLWCIFFILSQVVTQWTAVVYVDVQHLVAHRLFRYGMAILRSKIDFIVLVIFLVNKELHEDCAI